MPARKPSRRVVVVVFSALVAVLVLETAALAATLVRGGGTVTAVRTVTDADGIATANGSKTVMPQMLVNISVPPGERALLIITFSAETACQGAAGHYCYIQARVNSQQVSPGQVRLGSTSDNGSANAFESNSMQFVAGPVNSGNYTVDIRWWVQDHLAATFNVDSRTLTVLRSKV